MFWFTCLFVQVLPAQNALDKVMNDIDFGPDSLQSAFEWVAKNISYDVAQMQNITKRGKKRQDSRFQTEEAYDAHKLEEVINTRKGVCEGYALLFDNIARRLGYPAYVVEGYTKRENGNLNRAIGHAWNVVKVGGEWKFFDATWASGGVSEDAVFTAKYSPKWYAVDPQVMIVDHMPFDPMWQLLSSPITYEEFEESKPSSGALKAYNNADRRSFLQLSKSEKLKAILNRSDACGKGMGLVKKYRRYLKNNIGVAGRKDVSMDFNEAQDELNEGIRLMNAYITSKNARFQGADNNMDAAISNLKSAQKKVSTARAAFQNMKVESRKTQSIIKKVLRKSKDLMDQINSEVSQLQN